MSHRFTSEIDILGKEGLIPQRIGPIQTYHPAVLEYCPACGVIMQPGDYVAEVELGPGGDPEQRELCKNGETFSSSIIFVHYACRTGVEDHE